jgi:hypothetical protein
MRRRNYKNTTATISNIYRVSQEEWTKLRESVPYVKIYRYNPKHLYPKLNGYGDNGQRKVLSSLVFNLLYVFGLAAYPTLRMSVLERRRACSRSHIHVYTRLSVCTAVVLTIEVAVTYLLRVAKMPVVFSHMEYCYMHFVMAMH